MSAESLHATDRNERRAARVELALAAHREAQQKREKAQRARATSTARLPKKRSGG